MSLTDRAYALIRRDIVSCTLAPGAEFTEIDLAERLQMSKTPVREALARLQFEGLVKAYPRRGYQITPIRVSDINDIFDARIVVETGVVAMAVERASDAELDQLALLAAASSDDDYMRDLDHSQEVNTEFHEALALATGNLRLHRMVAMTLKELERFFYLEAQAEDAYPTSHVSHDDIVAIMRQRDPGSAQRAMREHVDGTRRVLIRSLLNGAIGTREGHKDLLARSDL